MDSLKLLRRYLRHPETCVASEVVELVCRTGITETLAELQTVELQTLLDCVEQLNSAVGYTQWAVTPEGPAVTGVVPEGFVDSLRTAIEELDSSEGDR